MTMHSRGPQSALFQPLVIGCGKIKLEHRVIHAPLTRNRGVPLNAVSTTENPNRIWYPGDLMVEYYDQRATKGGLLISEGVPPSLEVNHMSSSFSIITLPISKTGTVTYLVLPVPLCYLDFILY